MKPSAWIGAWLGAVFTTALVAVGYLQWKLLGLPFAPFDLFDALTRAMPSAVVTFGVESMVIVCRALHVATIGTAAKFAEQTMAVGLTIGIGVLVSALAFGVLRLSDESALPFGVILGGTWGAAATIMAHRLNRVAPGRAFASGSSLLLQFLIWGVALGWSNDRLREPPDSPDNERADGASRLDRRRFLLRLSGGMAAIAGAATTCGALLGAVRKSAGGARWSDAHALPNADAPVAAVPGTRTELTALSDHYRIDIDTESPSIDGRTWRLDIRGLVDAPLEISLDELVAYEPRHQFITLSCISNPVGGDLIGTTRWTGVSLQHLLPRLRLSPRATHLKIGSADGFSEVVALDTILADERVMLAYAWDGVPLPIEHGFPLRLYVPDLYGMKQPKWVRTIEAIDHWEPGYWVERGWDRQGRVKTTSVLDAVVVNAASGNTGDRTTVSIGGIAYAGARRVSRVEVQIGEGAWQEARLREPLSGTTWVLWRADLVLPVEAIVTVRCYDGDGLPQASDWDTARVSADGRFVRGRSVRPQHA